MSVIAELGQALQALEALKPPGVTKSRIASITTLCVENVQSESVLVQKIYTHFKKTASTHKLGVLYVVDSVTRQWIEKASATGRDLVGKVSEDGTFAAGINRMADLLPMMMNDLIHSAPDDQKEKIVKLVDIWERGSVFPATMLSDFKSKLTARMANPYPTVIAEPPLVDTFPKTKPITQSASEILSKIGSAKVAPPPPVPVPQAIQNPQQAAVNIANAAPVNQAASGGGAGAGQITQEQASALASIIPPHIGNDPAAITQYLQLIQQLVQMGVPQDQWSLVIAILQDQQAAAAKQQQAIPVPSTNRDRSRSPSRQNSSSNYRQRSPVRGNTPSMQQDKISLTEPKWTDFDPSLPEGHVKVYSRTLFVGGVTIGEDEIRRIFSQFGPVQTVIVNPEKRHAFVKMETRAAAVHAKQAMEKSRDPELGNKIRSTRWGVGFGPRDCSDYSTGVSVIPIERLTEADRKWVLTAQFGGTGGKALQTGIVMEEPDIEIGAGVSSKAISRRVNQPQQQQTPPQQHQQPQQSQQQRGGGGGNSGSPGRNQNSNKQHHGQQQKQQSFNQPQYGYGQYGAQYGKEQPQHYDPNSIGVPPAVPGFGFQLPTMPPARMGGMPPYGQ